MTIFNGKSASKVALWPASGIESDAPSPETVHFFPASNSNLELTWHKCKNRKCSTYCILPKKGASKIFLKIFRDTSKKWRRHVLDIFATFLRNFQFLKVQNCRCRWCQQWQRCEPKIACPFGIHFLAALCVAKSCMLKCSKNGSIWHSKSTVNRLRLATSGIGPF